MSESLKLTKGGKLVETKWVYDEAKKDGEYVARDVTDQAIRLMFDVVELEEGVTLKDLFLLMNTELDIFDAMIGNWCKEIVTEGLTKEPKQYGTYDSQEIEFLELYWNLWYDGKTPSFRGFSRPDLHGLGYVLQEDLMHSWGEIEWPKGHRIPWSLSFQSSNKLINIPIKLASEVPVYNDNLDDKDNWHRVLTTYQGAEYTLGNILYGIIWELSFHGGPESRDEAGAELKELAKEINDENSTKS